MFGTICQIRTKPSCSKSFLVNTILPTMGVNPQSHKLSNCGEILIPLCYNKALTDNCDRNESQKKVSGWPMLKNNAKCNDTMKQIVSNQAPLPYRDCTALEFAVNGKAHRLEGVSLLLSVMDSRNCHIIFFIKLQWFYTRW